MKKNCNCLAPKPQGSQRPHKGHKVLIKCEFCVLCGVFVNLVVLPLNSYKKF
jgi:hypothetical protein